MRFRESLWKPFSLTYVVFTDLTVKVRVSCRIRTLMRKSAYLAWRMHCQVPQLLSQKKLAYWSCHLNPHSVWQLACLPFLYHSQQEVKWLLHRFTMARSWTTGRAQHSTWGKELMVLEELLADSST